MIACRQRRPFEERVRDARLAAHLPVGRARHLVERFPPTRGEPGTGVGLLYHGDGLAEMLALFYAVTARERPGVVPTVGDLAWIAQMGEETAVDTACTQLDRLTRRLLDEDGDTLRGRIEAVSITRKSDPNWEIQAQVSVGAEYYSIDQAIQLA
jgi:hypothetical protein